MNRFKNILIIILLLNICSANAQTTTFMNKKKLINLNFGLSMPVGIFKATDSSGLFAKNGFDMDFSFIRLTKLGNLGVGFNIGYTMSPFNAEDFKYTFAAQEIVKFRNYNFIKFALDFYYPYMLVNVNGKSLNIFAKVTGGLQLNLPPEFTVKYAPTQNIYTEIEFKPLSTVSFYSELSGGFMVLFNDHIGFNISGSYFVAPRHTLNHQVYANTSFQNNEGAIEEITKITEYTNHVGIKAGFSFLW